MKLVREYLYESFSDDSDPINDMGIGNKVRIEKWLREMYITSWELNDDLSINVYDDVFLTRKLNENLPDYIQFNLVRGSFAIAFCNITSLKGCPIRVWGYFNCVGNKLTSLEFAPKEVRRTRQGSGAFHCAGQSNGHIFTTEDVKMVSNVEGKISV